MHAPRVQVGERDVPESQDRELDAASLAIAEGGRIHAVPTQGSLIVGRSETSDIWLDSSAISRHHARIAFGRGGLVIEDLGSRNGVTVNGVHVRGSSPLKVGDRIAMGDRILMVTSLDRTRLRTQPGDGGDGAERRPSGTVSRVTDGTGSTFALFLDTLRTALAEGRLQLAESAGRELADALDRASGPEVVEPALVSAACDELLLLADRVHNAAWLERIFEIRRHLELPLEAKATEAFAERIAEWPRVADDSGRRAYVSWMQSQPLRFTDRVALKRLADA